MQCLACSYYLPSFLSQYVSETGDKMRQLTLNEKISIKGVLVRYGLSRESLLRLDMESAIWFWSRCTGTSISKYHLYL